MNMQGSYSLIAIGAMVFYMTVVLFFFMYALMVRLVPAPVRILPAKRSRQRTFPRSR
jgi:hypothetical protein